MCGGEWVHGRSTLRRLGRPLPTPQDGDGPQEWFGRNRAWESPLEIARGYTQPLEVFALVESAMRARKGWTIDDDRDRISSVLSACSSVAAGHPNAWSPVARSAEDIRDATPDNRMVAFGHLAATTPK